MTSGHDSAASQAAAQSVEFQALSGAEKLREIELAELIAEQEQDMLYGDAIRYTRDVSLDAPISHDDHEGSSLAELVGDDDAELANILGENETWTRLVKQKAITEEDARFWRFLKEKQGWTPQQIADHVGVSRATVSKYVKVRSKRGEPRMDALAARSHAAQALYESGERLIDVAAAMYEQAGYKSAESCYQALRFLFLRRRVPLRPRSWKHGMRSRTAPPEVYVAYWKEQNRKRAEMRRATLTKCEASTREGRQCSRWARNGTKLCNVHAGLSGGPIIWTPEAICDALNRWRDEHGRYPKAKEWTHAAVEHPNFKTVYGKFPSWPAAMAMARSRGYWHREEEAQAA